MIATIVLCFALVFATLAALGMHGDWPASTPPVRRVHFGWLAVALYLLVEVLIRFGVAKV